MLLARHFLNHGHIYEKNSETMLYGLFGWLRK